MCHALQTSHLAEVCDRSRDTWSRLVQGDSEVCDEAAFRAGRLVGSATLLTMVVATMYALGTMAAWWSI